VKRGSSAMSWKSESERAWMRLRGLRRMASVRCSSSGGVSGHAGEDGEAVEGVVRAGVVGEDFFQLGARVFVVAVVEQGDGVVVALLSGVEAGLVAGGLLGAGVDVHADALGEVCGAGGEQLFEGVAGFVETWTPA